MSMVQTDCIDSTDLTMVTAACLHSLCPLVMIGDQQGTNAVEIMSCMFAVDPPVPIAQPTDLPTCMYKVDSQYCHQSEGNKCSDQDKGSKEEKVSCKRGNRRLKSRQWD